MPIAVIAAHPDDEVIGLATLLPRLTSDDLLIHVTDGAPRSGTDARNAGCSTWQEYAQLRRRELSSALRAAGAFHLPTCCLECADQEAAFHIADLASRLAAILQENGLTTVFTHAYEGGHPDHDSTAAAVHAANRLLGAPRTIIEFAGYHAGPSGVECESFLSNPAIVLERPLSDGQRDWKRGVLQCFTSQCQFFANFPLRREPLRFSPRYDFSHPPHGGSLHYERFPWGVSSVEWRSLLKQAFHALKVPCEC